MTDDEGFEAVVELGATISVADVDRALDFYCNYLGFQLIHEEEDPGQDRRVATIGYGNVVLDLVMGGPTHRRQNFRLFWTVDNLEAAIEHLRAGGGQVIRQLEYGVYCSDPDGNTILVKFKDLDPEQAQELYF